MKNKTSIILLTLLMVTACGQKKAEQFKALPFPNIELPGMMTDAQDITDYVAEHFWDRFLDPERAYPSDSLLISGVDKNEVEQMFSNWIAILERTDLKMAEKAISRAYSKALACEEKDTSSNAFESITGLADKYLYDANSPARNEEYYLYFVRRMAEYKGYSPEVRARYAYYAENCSLNRLGTEATDFRFKDKTGKTHTLHGIKAPLTLLFFSNPGCEACMSIINMLKEDPQIAEKISSGELAVLNIYIDEDLAGWKEYMPVYPEEWYNGFDPDLAIRTDNLYNVRAIPSLYLLDQDKRVLMKDAPENKVIQQILKGRLQ